MTITTKFSRGEQVVNAKTGKVFHVSEIRIRVWAHAGGELVLIEYRQSKPSHDADFPGSTVPGKWIPERDVRR